MPFSPPLTAGAAPVDLERQRCWVPCDPHCPFHVAPRTGHLGPTPCDHVVQRVRLHNRPPGIGRPERSAGLRERSGVCHHHMQEHTSLSALRPQSHAGPRASLLSEADPRCFGEHGHGYGPVLPRWWVNPRVDAATGHAGRPLQRNGGLSGLGVRKLDSRAGSRTDQLYDLKASL